MEKYIHKVCAPLNSTNQPDMNFPCHIADLVRYECLYGAEKGTSIFQGLFSGTSLTAEPRGKDQQRICICESQWFNQIVGCGRCEYLHGGGPNPLAYLGNSAVSSMSSSYCAVTATPTQGLVEYYNEWTKGSLAPPWLKSMISAASSRFKDPLSTGYTMTSSYGLGSTIRTAVEYYFTPSVTGTEAWKVQAITDSAGSTIWKTADGEIVATGRSVVMEAAAVSVSRSTTVGGRISERVLVGVGAAGLVGFFVAVAIL
jgi:hypothetical protein